MKLDGICSLLFPTDRQRKGGVWFGAAVTKLQMSGVVAQCCLVGRIWYGRDVGDGVWVPKT